MSAKKKVKKPRRVVLFPTEPTSIPKEEIERAVLKVIADRKAREKAERSRK
ncbi:MAG TPA: hypothetical protein VMU84_02740 [Thermoanaerobaculia bacterium]|nr:hypothetical protein [Thermoanaerobaculia bacterium]